jgi:hypothetical protein
MLPCGAGGADASNQNHQQDSRGHNYGWPNSYRLWQRLILFRQGPILPRCTARLAPFHTGA